MGLLATGLKVFRLAIGVFIEPPMRFRRSCIPVVIRWSPPIDFLNLRDDRSLSSIIYIACAHQKEAETGILAALLHPGFSVSPYQYLDEAR